jgi:hypothetical protein
MKGSKEGVGSWVSGDTRGKVFIDVESLREDEESEAVEQGRGGAD